MKTIPTIGITGSPWLTPDEAARYARADLREIYRAYNAKELLGAPYGKRQFRTRRDWLDHWLESRAGLTPPAARTTARPLVLVPDRQSSDTASSL